MKKFLSSIFLFVVLSNTVLANCHEIVGKKLNSIGKKAHMALELSTDDLIWLQERLEMAVSRADGNNFSCSFNDGGIERTTVSHILLRQEDIPASVKILILRNDKLLADLVSHLN